VRTRAALCAGTVMLAIAAASAGGATAGAPARCVAEVAASGEPVATTVGIRTVTFVDHSRHLPRRRHHAAPAGDADPLSRDRGEGG
jgi:predicted RNA methylase